MVGIGKTPEGRPIGPTPGGRPPEAPAELRKKAHAEQGLGDTLIPRQLEGIFTPDDRGRPSAPSDALKGIASKVNNLVQP